MAQKKKNVRKKYLRGVVTPSREPAVIGAVCGAIFLIVTILCILDHAPRNTCIVCGVLTALNIPLLLTSNLRIEFHEKRDLSAAICLAGERFINGRISPGSVRYAHILSANGMTASRTIP